jgi:hypothetical protein
MSANVQIQNGQPVELWTTEETAAYLRVPITTLHRWRYVGTGPAAHRVGKHLRYDPAEVMAWVRSQ